MRITITLTLLAIMLLLPMACSDIAVDEPEGVEGAKCYPNGSCKTGLECINNLCVNLGVDAHDATTEETSQIETISEPDSLTGDTTSEIKPDAQVDTGGHEEAILPDEVTPCSNECDSDGLYQCTDNVVTAICQMSDAGCLVWATTIESCDDGKVCTDDSCNADGECLHVPNTLACDDDNELTYDDTCVDGQCTGTPCKCQVVDDCCDGCHPKPDAQACDDDGYACTSDVCSSGICSHEINEEWCLIEGICYQDGDLEVENGCRVCSTEATQTDWINLPNGTSCDDGNASTGNDTCNGGDCTGLPCTCFTTDECCDGCFPHESGKACSGDDLDCTDDVCDGAGACIQLVAEDWCWIDGECFVDAQSNPANFCQKCDVVASPEAWDAKADEISCDDGDSSTCNDACSAGVCEGVLSTCSEIGECCDGCETLNEGGACTDDGLDCTTDTCLAGECAHAVDDGMCAIAGACYADADPNPDSSCMYCDVVYNQTQWRHKDEGAACDDGIAWTDDEKCQADGTCKGTGCACAPGTDCCDEECNPINAGGACEDGDLCTEGDACDDAGSCVPGDTVLCDSPDECQGEGICLQDTGLCDYPPADDGISCTDDGLSCTDDLCIAGECIHSLQPGHCLIDEGCYVDAATNSDNDCLYCDSDAFAETWSLASNGMDCDDANQCTGQDSCQAGVCQGSTDAMEGVACDDGDPLTSNEKCHSGDCLCEPTCAPYTCGTDDMCGGTCTCPDGGACNAKGYCEYDGMVLVPAGTFWMGCNAAIDNDCKADEFPYHEVYLDAFLIEITEVTVSEYTACVNAGVCAIPAGTDSGCTWGVAGKENYPIVCLDWYQAATYAEWTGKSLCTAAQWEKAARGVNGQIYPWGNTPATCELAVMKDASGTGCGEEQVCEVGTKPLGASPYGALDMAGNVYEWAADWYDSDAYSYSPSSNPLGGETGEQKAARGGSYFNDDIEDNNVLRSSHRGGNYPNNSNHHNIGLRTCKSFTLDLDSDGILADGDGSGVDSDNPCTGGETTNCDDNCPEHANPDQADYDGDGIGDACSEMVLVPAGTFWMGCNSTVDTDCESDESPYHEVYLDAFAIDRTEVTTDAYLACVNTGYCNEPSPGELCNFGVAGKGSHPVNCIIHAQADEYCSWAGKRLCTEAEWEKAAKGGCELYTSCEAETPKFPWPGSDISCNHAVWSGESSECGVSGTMEVGSKPLGTSPYGAEDMVGNVCEWVSDWYDSAYYSVSPYENPTGPATGTSYVKKSSGWSGVEAIDTRPSNRSWDSNVWQGDYIGFRCCIDQ